MTNKEDNKKEPISVHKISKDALLPLSICTILRNLGFKYGCRNFYNDDVMKHYNDGNRFCCNDTEDIACPTIEQCGKWLRDEKHIVIQMIYSFAKNEWAAYVNETYYWGETYELVYAEGIARSLDILLGESCKIKFV